MSQLSAVAIPGVAIDGNVCFTSRVKKTASKAPGRLSCVRRVSYLSDARGATNLYATRVRSVMEYTFLTWSSCPAHHTLVSLTRFRTVCSWRLITTRVLPHEQVPSIPPLQHTRDVAGLCATYKIHREGASLPLKPLSSPPTVGHTSLLWHERKREGERRGTVQFLQR